MGHEFYVDKKCTGTQTGYGNTVESALECMKAEKSIFLICVQDPAVFFISILKERADAHGTGVDLSDEALKVAVRNARTLEVADMRNSYRVICFLKCRTLCTGTEYMKRTAVKIL